MTIGVENPMQWPLLVPRSTSNSNVLVPKRFLNVVALHVVKNHLPDLNPSLILAIQGGPGEGKSFQTREALSMLEAFTVPLSGSSLAGQHEGDATNALATAYKFAAAVQITRRRMTALLVDDFDMSVAATVEGRTYTANTQLITGALMNLADNPRQLGMEATVRVPIIVTGNNFEGLHTPLMRHGRMDFFEWKPTAEERLEIVSKMFEYLLEGGSKNSVKDLVGIAPDQPISFFSAVKEDIVNAVILDHINQGAGINLENLGKRIKSELGGRPIQEFILAAKRRLGEVPTDYVPKRKSRWRFN
jgi:hypothetical protein